MPALGSPVILNCSLLVNNKQMDAWQKNYSLMSEYYILVPPSFDEMMKLQLIKRIQNESSSVLKRFCIYIVHLIYVEAQLQTCPFQKRDVAVL